MSIKQRLIILFFGQFVGKDELGNKYYEERKKAHGLKPRRWVVYSSKNLIDASQVPAMWHAWLHHYIDKVPSEKKFTWQKPHTGNVTGTINVTKPNKEFKKKKTYTPWMP